MKKSVAVLGLGKFGSSIARSLAKGGAPCRIPRTAVAFRHGKPKPCDCSII